MDWGGLAKAAIRGDKMVWYLTWRTEVSIVGGCGRIAKV
jgi:hypothetical protein